MKKWAVVLVGIILSVMLVGCGDKANVDTSQVYSAKAEEIVKWINDKNYDKITEQFDENLKAQLTADQLAQIEPVIAQSGDFEKVEKSTVEEKDGMKVVVLVAQYSNEKRVFTVTYDDKDKIAGLFVQ
ncbi:DUF3887 domain-containing protein [Solibacillus sp. MA9]|uniref:DUF3887 domain-containing protein n=1 Tax=Solibacillus palustris TaxID=2908203 RepID=A0ABS9UHB5_9BACL|nr:DUF3887 domain-containing protein [Solibacillus sp. MA9]MCH7323737.1 DUF3887 domain-containing protein [Solibacillus sp. MA9]